MTIRDILSDPTLQQKKILEKLLCFYADITKEDIFISYEKELTKDQYDNIIAWYNAYTKDKKPLEFILGFVEFFKRKFAVDGRCLIPRPETEYMIQAVHEHITNKKQSNKAPLDTKENCPTNQDSLLIRWMDGQPTTSGQLLHSLHSDSSVSKWLLSPTQPSQRLEEQGENHDTKKNILIDVWTGCGVLWLSVLLENSWYFDTAFLTEYYPETLTLAKENTDSYKEKLQPVPTLLQANLIDFMLVNKTAFENSNVVLVANLPYIPDETFDTQTEDNVRKWEPRPAFVGGDDWLDFYREMFEQLFQTYETGLEDTQTRNMSISMFLEMMTRQVDILRKEFGDKLLFEEIKTFHFNIRIVKATLL